MRERSGLLVELGLGSYAFSHLTFQEYLCAREIVEDEKVRPLLLEMAGDEWWQEVTLLYVGITDATPVVEALLEAVDDETCARLLLAGRCMAEAVRVEEGARERVTRRLEESFATCTGDVFLRTGQVLAEIAGEDSVDFFLRLAQKDPGRREAALWALGQMGRQPNEALRERVLERLVGYFQREELRQEAGVALVYSREATVDDRVLLDVLQEEPDVGVVAALAGVLDKKVVDILAGEFLMGDEKRGVFVETFQIDRYTVTNGQYGRFLEATGHNPPGHWRGGTYCPVMALDPVVNVSWYDAVAYAEWAGKRLPTEEEWEKAARGTDGREYPWGDWQEGRCNTEEAGVGETTPVGRYSPAGDSPSGCADMAGNVWEWTVSSWESGSSSRVVRGGSWDGFREDARCATRDGYYPYISNELIGFRCVSSV